MYMPLWVDMDSTEHVCSDGSRLGGYVNPNEVSKTTWITMDDINTRNEDSADLLRPWIVIEIEAAQSQNITYKAQIMLVRKIKE